MADPTNPAISTDLIKSSTKHKLYSGANSIIYQCQTPPPSELIVIAKVTKKPKGSLIPSEYSMVYQRIANSSPFICHCFGFDPRHPAFDRKPTLLLEYFPFTILDLMAMKTPPTEQLDLLVVLYDVALGLQELHRQSLMHRDLKPDNVVVSDKFRAKLIDFEYTRPILTEQEKKSGGTIEKVEKGPLPICDFCLAADELTFR